ncbi:MAG TPA: SprT-like domain-containing protein [Gemmatimonadaceae bacterium]|nr:SprT-like domain-containing protein [Gemmatimonadaceae bacterium]
MLRSLSSLLRRRFEAAQLTLEFDATPQPRDAAELLARLRALGLKRIASCELTRNRNVMVSFRGHELRVHEGYLAAPEDVHRAIVGFIEGRTRAERGVARRRIVSYKVETPARGPARRERTRPEDEPLAAKLTDWHARYNAEHFGGALKPVPVRVSRRMKSRLGHYTAATKDGPAEIAISWRHLRRHGWTEALHTLLHEMVHQWQDETGIPIDHGARFRAKARDVGIEAAAKRAVARG